MRSRGSYTLRPYHRLHLRKHVRIGLCRVNLLGQSGKLSGKRFKLLRLLGDDAGVGTLVGNEFIFAPDVTFHPKLAKKTFFSFSLRLIGILSYLWAEAHYSKKVSGFPIGNPDLFML